MTNTNLSPLDRWMMARLLAGYDQKRVEGMSKRAIALFEQLSGVNFKDRDFLLKRNVSSGEHKSIAAIDPDTPMPKAPKQAQAPFRVIHARDLKNLPPLRWIIPGEIPESSLCVIFGESGAGKSFVSIDYALRVAQTRRVVYIPTEGELGYRKRVEAWCKHHRQPEGDLHFILGAINLYDKRAFIPLLATIAELKPALVVIDTLAAASAGADENSSRDMGLILRSCRDVILESDATVMLIHHVGKAGATERGSSALRGNADVMIRVSPADDVVLIECSKTKDEKAFDPRFISLLPVALEGEENSLVVISAAKVIQDGSLTMNQRKLLEVMALEVNQSGVSLRDLAEVASLSLGATQRALSNMMKNNYVEKRNGFAITSKGLLEVGSTPIQTDSKSNTESVSSSVDPLESVDPTNRAQKNANKPSDSVIQPIQVDQVDQPLLLDATKKPNRKSTNYDMGA